MILANIQLARHLDAVVNALLRSFAVLVGFISPYPERFLIGDRPEPAFLISKPSQARVVFAASRALFFQRNSPNRAPRAAAIWSHAF